MLCPVTAGRMCRYTRPGIGDTDPQKVIPLRQPLRFEGGGHRAPADLHAFFFHTTIDDPSRCAGASTLRGPISQETAMKIVTSLSFQGQCREAFEFYASVFG